MINEVIVVEGRNDTLRLQSFFAVETIETQGLGLSREKIELIRQVNEKRGVILLLDPDHPGETIRKKINDSIPGLKNAFIFKEDARTKKKVGIEHATKEALENALNNCFTYIDDNDQGLKMTDLLELDIDSKQRDKLCHYYHLGKCNNKTFLKRLRMLNITKEDLKCLLPL